MQKFFKKCLTFCGLSNDKKYILESLKIQAMAVRADLDGMQVDNEIRLRQGLSVSYCEDLFALKSRELMVLSRKVRDLMNI